MYHLIQMICYSCYNIDKHTLGVYINNIWEERKNEEV